MILSCAPAPISTPEYPFGIAAVPAAFTPIQFPSDDIAVRARSWSMIDPLAGVAGNEIACPGCGAADGVRCRSAKSVDAGIARFGVPLPIAALPAGFVPMKFPAITVPARRATALPRLPESTLPAPGAAGLSRATKEH